MYTGNTICLNCGHIFEKNNIFEGCPYCKTENFVSNVTPIYELTNTDGSKKAFHDLFCGSGINRYLAILPFSPETKKLVSLNEGDTPLTELERLGNELGIQLFAKDETRNPTWSHKDRLNVIEVNKAIEQKAPGVIYASTGNNGASGAAYAAKAGIPCIVLTVKGMNQTLETFMQSYGACVIGVKTMADRWKLLKECVESYGWYPATNYTIPIVGSNPWAIDGYKIIAYELYQQCHELPDKIVVPICYGDALFGIMKGFSELKEMGFLDRIPQMVSVEDYGPVDRAFRNNTQIINPVENWGSNASSMSIIYGTYHSLYTLRKSNGVSVALKNNDEIAEAQLELARKEGIYCESASATTLAGIKRLLNEGKIKKGEKVVILITSSGVKDTKVVTQYVGEVPECEANMEDMSRLMREAYGITL